MKHDKKHKKNKSSKRSKKSKKTDRKEKKHKHKQKKKISKKLEKELKNSEEMQVKVPAKPDEDDYCGPSIDLMNRAKCPETKAEYDHRQNQIKRVVDKETGRIRLIKGDGEILEEIVSRERHQQINKEATRNDGSSFQKNTVGLTRK